MLNVSKGCNPIKSNVWEMSVSLGDVHLPFRLPAQAIFSEHGLMKFSSHGVLKSYNLEIT